MILSRRAVVLGLALVFLVALAGRLTSATETTDPVASPASAGEVATSFRAAPGETSRVRVEAAPVLPRIRVRPEVRSFADTLRAGETLSDLFARSSLGGEEARVLLTELAPHQDVRRIRPGFVVRYVRSADGEETQRMDAQLDPDRTLAVRRDNDSWEAAVEEVPVAADTVVLAGEVRSSLYGALTALASEGFERRELEQLVDAMADEIFAWRIDFARDLRRGDPFRLVYERMVRPDGSVRSSRVLAVEMSVNNRDYHAYHFEEGDTHGYFDREGGSLRRAFLRAPLRYRRISSVYTDNRLHPVTGRNRPHRGIDYAAPTGTPVYAAADGTIQRAGRASGYGNVVDIRHTRGYSTRYAHLSRFESGIRRGMRVRQGEVIGYVGMTGLATGPHLHYEFHVGGRAHDPRTSVPELAGDPVPAGQQTRFASLVTARRRVLDRGSLPILAADRPSADGAGGSLARTGAGRMVDETRE